MHVQEASLRIKLRGATRSGLRLSVSQEDEGELRRGLPLYSHIVTITARPVMPTLLRVE